MTGLVIDIALPPSANKLFKNVPQGGRARTREYNAWIEAAGYDVETAWRAAGRPTFLPPLAIDVRLGLVGRKRDAGNTLKAIEDLLVKRIDGLPDDKFNDDIRIRRDAAISASTARVTITSLPSAPPG